MTTGRWIALGLLATAASLPSACIGADDFEGCWQIEEESRTISFLALSDAREAVGIELRDRDGGGTRQTELRGRWETTGPDEYTVDASCERVLSDDAATCEGVPAWALACRLLGEGELECLGAPFSGPTTLGPCKTTDDAE